MKSIKLFTLIISTVMLCSACNKDESYDSNSNVTLPYGFYVTLENNCKGPGVNTCEDFFFYDDKSFEEWRTKYNMSEESIQLKLSKYNYGYLYVNVTDLTVFSIHKWISEPGCFIICGEITNDKRFKGIYYSLKFDVTYVSENVYRLTFVGENSPIFMYGDNIVVRYLADIECYDLARQYRNNH